MGSSEGVQMMNSMNVFNRFAMLDALCAASERNYFEENTVGP